MNHLFNNSSTRRRPTKTVHIGHIQIGSEYPICNQSMTTTPTKDVDATVEQIIDLAENSCEIARVTVQGIAEAKACEAIKDKLLKQGVNIPLVADIHFFPQAAMHVADFVDKVRINPGNYVDKRNMFNDTTTYDESAYQKALQRLDDKFSPLVEKCKRLKRAMRIGVNHGSLSERIMQKYGDTIEGMVASAMEYTQVCVQHDYHDLVFSMKSSNPKVMVAAYRLLAEKLDAVGWNYPLHLGVTEAGMGIDGIIKSSVGIGTLLAEGLGDTIRSSLTGSPILEIPVCNKLIKKSVTYLQQPTHYNPFAIKTSQDLLEQTAKEIKAFSPPWGDTHFGVIIQISQNHLSSYEKLLSDLGITIEHDGNCEKDFTTPDAILIEDELDTSPIIQQLRNWIPIIKTSELPLLQAHQGLSEDVIKSNYYRLEAQELFIDNMRSFFHKHQPSQQIALCINYFDSNEEEASVSISMELGAILLDKLGNACVLNAPNLSLELLRTIAFGTLQSASIRSVKTEFISCPGCGRTLFDLPTVTSQIKEKTAHLPGLKIAVMGCIVNGPGEMADADFGFVGSKTGMIDLYVKHRCAKMHIPMGQAVEELILLLKEHNVWVEPKETVNV